MPFPGPRWPGSDVTALQLLVPEAVGLVDAVRGLPGVGLLEPPHISLGYPWLAPEEAATSVARLRTVAAATAGLSVLLQGPQMFEPDRRGRRVVHALPEPSTPLRALARELAGRSDPAPITPHLSIARLASGCDPDEVMDLLRPLLPLPVRLDQLELSTRTRGRWQVRERLILGGTAPGSKETRTGQS